MRFILFCFFSFKESDKFPLNSFVFNLMKTKKKTSEHYTSILQRRIHVIAIAIIFEFYEFIIISSGTFFITNSS